MSRGINKVILIGNLGAAPETRYTTSGTAVTNIRVATSDIWTDKQTGEKQERTEWHTVVFFNRLAEIAGQYLGKGDRVYIEGSLRTRKWQDRTGLDRYTTEVVANEMEMLGGSGSAQEPRNRNGAQQAPQQRPQRSGNGDALPPQDFDDDIPF